MIEYHYRVVSRWIPHSPGWLRQKSYFEEVDMIFDNDWNQHDIYSTEATCKGQITRLKRYSYGESNVEYKIQRRPKEEGWEFV